MDVLGQDRREGLGKKADPRVGLVLLFLVSVLLLLSSLYSAEASVFKKARETVLDAASPALELLSAPIRFVEGVVGNVRDYFNVLEQNQALREENAELRQWMNEALALREIIASYESLQTYYAPTEAKPIDAFVIGESNDAFAHSMIVNAGAAAGVERDQAVVDDKGLVGRVVDAGAKASRILLLTDVQSKIPVLVEGAEVEAILVGRNRPQPAISFTQSSDAVTFAPGQRVLTSSAGGVLPRGLPVGVIAELRDGEALIDLYANYARTRMVRILNYDFPEVEPVSGQATAAEEAAAAPAPLIAETPSAPPPPPAPIQTDDEGREEPLPAPGEAIAPSASVNEEPLDEPEAPND